jgi:Rod binding domain-containing protein
VDPINLIFTDPALMPSPLRKLDSTEALTADAKEKFAKDFEFIFINKLLDIMQSTIGDGGFEKDGASEQITGLFSTYLARHAADNGGLGLWKEIYSFLNQADNPNPKTNSLETAI